MNFAHLLLATSANNTQPHRSTVNVAKKGYGLKLKKEKRIRFATPTTQNNEVSHEMFDFEASH